MNEEDTFNKLRRLPFDEAGKIQNQIIHALGITYRPDLKAEFQEKVFAEMFRLTGWTYEAYMEESNRWLKNNS